MFLVAVCKLSSDATLLLLLQFLFSLESFSLFNMSYQLLIVGDSNVVRFWEAAQISRPQLVGVTLKPVSCMDTLASSLADVNDGLDYVLISVLTSLLIDEVSPADLRGSSYNIIRDAYKIILSASKKASRVEVGFFFVVFLLSISKTVLIVSNCQTYIVSFLG